MKSKRVYIALIAAYFALVAVAVMPGQRLGSLLPGGQAIDAQVYQDVIFALLLGAFVYATFVISTQALKQEKIEHKNTEGELLRQRSQVSALSQTAAELNSRRDPLIILDYICKQLASVLDVPAATLTAYDAPHGMMELVTSFGLLKGFNDDFRPVNFAGNAARLIGVSDPIVVASGDNDLPDLPNKELYLKQNFSKLAYLPLHHADDFLGELVIVLFHPEAEFTSEQLDLLKAFGDQISVVLRNSHLSNTLQETKKKLDALRTGDLAILSSLDLNLTLRIFLQQVVAELQVDAADVLFLNGGTQTLEYAAGIGFMTGKIKETHVHLGEGHSGKIALERRSIYLSDFHDNGATPFTRGELIAAERFASYFGVPLVAKGQLKGILEVFHRRPFYPSDQWLSFLEMLAGQSAIAIDNASLFSNLQHSNMDLKIAYDRTLEGWSRALDLRDHETEGHTRRVTELCLELAQALNVNEHDLVSIRRGALLHDIGKMGVPDQILHKPSELTPEEFKIVQSHPVSAYEMLS
ncbi:MAG TPA: GAF domain-containing protein, partial [Anaerolineales bacterium]|nr:GAF domain-containing protein [Anaerolineales bacterium]